MATVTRSIVAVAPHALRFFWQKTNSNPQQVVNFNHDSTKRSPCVVPCVSQLNTTNVPRDHLPTVQYTTPVIHDQVRGPTHAATLDVRSILHSPSVPRTAMFVTQEISVRCQLQQSHFLVFLLSFLTKEMVRVQRCGAQWEK